MEQKKQLHITKVLLAVYLIALIWIILFKMQVRFDTLFRMEYRSINLIPFQGSVIVNGKLSLSEIVLNILVFFPLGIYVSILRPDWNVMKKILPAFCLSFVLETAQYILGIGASDITDLIGNTLGGGMGVFAFSLLLKVFKGNTIRILNILAAIFTVLAVMLLGILVFANL